MTAKVEDVRQVVTSDFKQADDVIYLLGETYDELGGSEFYQLYNELGANVPQVRFEEAKALYTLVGEANAQGLIQSSHDLSDGGLAVALAESTFGRDGLGADLDLGSLAGDLSPTALLFSESHSRFVVSIAPEDVTAFEGILGQRATRLGRVTADGQLRVVHGTQELLNASTHDLRTAWTNGPVNQTIGLEPAEALQH
jgi:phosphoribosylformylglycinamidine synthase